MGDGWGHTSNEQTGSDHFWESDEPFPRGRQFLDLVVCRELSGRFAGLLGEGQNLAVLRMGSRG